jgi:hypothetical protein
MEVQRSGDAKNLGSWLYVALNRRIRVRNDDRLDAGPDACREQSIEFSSAVGNRSTCTARADVIERA